MKRILFFTHDDLIMQDALFARAARDRLGLQSVALVLGSRDSRMADAEHSFAEVVDLTKDFRPESTSAGIGKAELQLANLETEYPSNDTVSAAYLQDRWLTKRFSPRQAYVYGGHILNRLDTLAQQCEPIALIGELTMLHHRLARMRFHPIAPYLFPIGARFFTRFYLEDSLSLEWRACQTKYKEYLRHRPPNDSTSAARKVIDGIRTRHEAPKQFKYLVAHPAHSAEPISEKLHFSRAKANLDYWRYQFPERRRNPRILLTGREMFPPNKVLRWAREARRRAWLTKHQLSELPSNSEFVTIYLHYQPEYTVDTVAYPFVNQLEWVRLIAQSVPGRLRVLVKEQPFMIGARPTEFYKKMLAFPNVELLSASVNSREAARKSKAVFTLAGTVALEAMILGVPSFVFSPVFYSDFEGIIRVTDPANLPSLVRNLESYTPASSKAQIAAIAAMFEASSPGQLYGSIVSREHFLDPVNVENIANSFCQMLASFVYEKPIGNDLPGRSALGGSPQSSSGLMK